MCENAYTVKNYCMQQDGYVHSYCNAVLHRLFCMWKPEHIRVGCTVAWTKFFSSWSCCKRLAASFSWSPSIARTMQERQPASSASSTLQADIMSWEGADVHCRCLSISRNLQWATIFCKNCKLYIVNGLISNNLRREQMHPGTCRRIADGMKNAIWNQRLPPRRVSKGPRTRIRKRESAYNNIARVHQ